MSTHFLNLESRVSYSAINQHRQCPQSWNYAYVQRLEPMEQDTSLMEFGTWWHALRAADSIVRGTEFGTLKAFPESISLGEFGTLKFVGVDTDQLESRGYPVYSLRQTQLVVEPQTIKDLSHQFWNSLDPEKQEVWINHLGEPMPDRLSNLNDSYINRWMKSRQHEYPVAVEMWFTKELPSGAEFRGIIDEIYFDSHRNMLVARDHKTTKSGLTSFSSADDMMDSQLYMYAWGISELVEEWEKSLNAKLVSLEFDRVRSVKPKTPEVTKSGTLSKSIKDYDLHTYVKWARGSDGNGVPFAGLKKDGSGSGFYTIEEEVVKRLSAPDEIGQWFRRFSKPVNFKVINYHLEAAEDSFEDMKRSLKLIETRGYAPRNFSKRICGYCPFVKLCRDQMFGGADGDFQLEDYGLKRR